jgi:cytoskeleton protein RodZ
MTDNMHNELNLEQLRARREKQGLSVADLANRIKVSREIINHIEQGEFNRIGSGTFIRGHVGNYARELGFDPQSVLALVPAQHLKPYEPKLSSSKVSNPLSRVKTQSSGFGRYVLGTFLVAALGLSFYFVYDKWDSREVDFSQQTALHNSDLTDNDTSKKKKVIYSSLLPQADMVDEDSQSEDTSQTVHESSESEATQLNIDGLETQQSDTPFNSESGNDSVDGVSHRSQQQNETEKQTTSVLPQYALSFDLTEQAWVSIKTRSGETIVSDLIGPGERQFSADEPLHLRIGNAGALSLQINDQAIDLGQYTRQNVADFNWPIQEG